jgi:hypothetical protein
MSGKSTLLERLKLVQAFAPSVDINDTNPAGKLINLALYSDAVLLLHTVATTGTAIITMEACDDSAGTNPVAIPFRKQVLDTGGSPVDAMGAPVDVLAAGFTTVVSKTSVYALAVRGDAMPAGKNFVRPRLTEGVNAPVIGSALWLLHHGRFAGAGTNLPSAVS